jgi:hypothetical protein
MSRCGCRSCGIQFSSLSAFDRHLRWSRSAPWLTHVEPGRVGLVESGGVWSAPHSAHFRPATVGGMSTYSGEGSGAPASTVEGCVASSVDR